MALDKMDIVYFNRDKAENKKFWQRFGNPDIKGEQTTVLDAGCGYGSMCIDAAQAGAGKVVGVELFQRSSLKIVSFKVNCSNHPVSKLFTLISRIPGLEEYFSHNIYCILERP